MSEVGMKPQSPLLDSGCTPFRVPQAPTEVHDFEIFASISRQLRGKPSEQDSLLQATEFRNKIKEHEGSNHSSKNGKKILETMERVASIPASSGQKKFLTFPLVPIVPAISELGGFTLQKGRPWNPGAYVKKMIFRGAPDFDSGCELWKDLFDVFYSPRLNPKESDAWAVVCDSAVQQVSSDLGIHRDLDFEQNINDSDKDWGDLEKLFKRVPVKSFVQDLKVVLRLHENLTRKQWVSLMDCFLRLAVASDILWICQMGEGLAWLISGVCKGGDIPKVQDLPELLMPGDNQALASMIFEGEFVKILKRQVRNYSRSVLVIDQLLDDIKKNDAKGLAQVEEKGLKDSQTLLKLLQLCKDLPSESFDSAEQRVAKRIDENPQFSNLTRSQFWNCAHYYALRYALGQRGTKERSKTHFDQGYWAKVIGNKWKFSPGPLALFLMSHLSNEQNDGIATTSALQQKLLEYGYFIPLKELVSGRVGNDLRHLGLVVDCPDAQGGLIVRSPFAPAQKVRK